MRQSCDLGFTSEELGVHIMTEKGSPGAGQGSEMHTAQADARAQAEKGPEGVPRAGGMPQVIG